VAKTHEVTVFDGLFFGCMRTAQAADIPGDIRHGENRQALRARMRCTSCGISNDASFELDGNFDIDQLQLLRAADRKRPGVRALLQPRSRRARSAVKAARTVTRIMPMVPLTLYKQFKGMCEPLLWKHTWPTTTAVTIRPDTVRLQPARLITVGQHPDQPRGQQGASSSAATRCANLHIGGHGRRTGDAGACPEIHGGEVFNIGREPLVASIAKMVQKIVLAREFPTKGRDHRHHVTTPSDDLSRTSIPI